MVDTHGAPLEPPIALVEAQGYALRAKRGIAGLFELAGDAARAAKLRAGATVLEEGIERFWLEDLGYYAMALDGEKRPSRALASNQGHLLWAGAVPPERAGPIRDAVMSEAMFSGWGIRTLAEGERAYNPVGYHTGSIWPHDSALIAVGLRRYGFDEDFSAVFEGLLEAASQFSNYRLPELFAGFSRTEYESPVPYPVGLPPAGVGRRRHPPTDAVGLRPQRRGVRPPAAHNPALAAPLDKPGAVPAIPVAGASIDLCFERIDDQVRLADARIDGDVEVSA